MFSHLLWQWAVFEAGGGGTGDILGRDVSVFGAAPYERWSGLGVEWLMDGSTPSGTVLYCMYVVEYG